MAKKPQLSKCMQFVERMHPADQESLLNKLDALVESGVPASKAQIEATQALIAEIVARRDALTGTRTATQALVSAAGNTATGLANAIDGLGALFGGGPGRLGSGLSFDEDTYAKAKPLFTQALADIKDAGADLKEAMRAIVRMVLDKFGRNAAEQMKPYVVRFILDVQAGKIKLEKNDATATGNDPQSGSDQGQAGAPGNTGAVPDAAGDAGQVPGRPVRGPAEGGARPAGGAGVPGAGAAAAGERGDQPIRGADGRLDAQSDTARGADTDGSGGAGRPGSVSDGRAKSGTDGAASLEQRLAAQKAAESIAVTFGDADNIAATLPLLMPSQHEDVRRAEQRLAKPDGYGMLFTNGTGTGKTFLGLGIVKRMVKAGKGNGLVVVPNDAVMNEWTRSAAMIGLKITPLSDTSDAGTGVAITTYANLANNLALADRSLDFFVSDEAHTLMSNAAAGVTSGLKAARAITLHPDGAHYRTDMIEREAVARLAEIVPRIDQLRKTANMDDTMDVMRADYLKEAAELDKEADKLRAKYQATLEKVRAQIEDSQNEKRPRAVFLSATPFAYEKNVEWAQGFLFSYPEVKRTGRYNEPDGQQQFMINHFGYRMRTGKLNEPDAKVDRGLMQRQFNTWMRQQGVLSARMLDVDQDYDRKFVLIDGGIGTRIDAALKWLRESNGGRYRMFFESANEKFDYLSRSRLLEAIKAKAAVPYIKAQHALGRKVVVFYDYNEGGGFNPFGFDGDRNSIIKTSIYNQDTLKFDEAEFKLGEFLDDFKANFPDLNGEAFARAMSPIQTLTAAFPEAGVYNGVVPKATRQQAIDKFNDDGNPGANLLIVQSAANAGWSGHDKSGKFQRVLINLGLPVAPTKAIQQEGRIYRVGQASDAIFRYFNTGTLWERGAFATKVARRASTAENLAMGEDARGLLQSFLDAFDETGDYQPSRSEGKGGKALDRALASTLSEFDRAKSFFYGQQKKNSSTKAREGKDYFATPEPIGLKMVQWLHPEAGDRLLEPSAGHGAIARWFPDTTERTVVEPSMELAGRLQLITDARMVNDHFEALNIVNKYEGIAMNPPFGTGGRTAVDHIAKAYNHLADGGRLVAILPVGPAADAKFDAWINAKDAKGRYLHPDATLIASILLPGSTFNRAGTGVMTRIVIIDKLSDPKMARQATQSNIDLSRAESVEELFDIIENLDFMRARTLKEVQAPTAAQAASSNPAMDERPQATPKASELASYSFEVKGSMLVTDSPAAEITTKAGKVLLGVYVPDGKMAKSVDNFTWKPAGAPGFFVRMKHVQRPALETRMDASSGDALPRFAARFAGQPLNIKEALFAAEQITGLGFGAEVVMRNDMPEDVPMRVDMATRVIEVNSKFVMTQAEAVQYLIEELLHRVDVLSGGNRAISYGSARLHPVTGDMGREAQAAFENDTAGLRAFLSYPLSNAFDFDVQRIKAELFARLGTLYFADPTTFKRVFPNAHAFYDSIFQVAVQGDQHLLRKIWSEAQTGVREVHSGSQPGGQGGLRSGQSSGERRATGLERLRIAIGRGLSARIEGTPGQRSGGQGNYLEARNGVRATNGPQAPIPATGQNGSLWDAGTPSKLDNFIDKLQDRHINLKRVQAAITEVTAGIPEQFDAYQKEELYHGRVSSRTNQFLERELKPLLMDMKLKGITMDELEAYLWARHAPERNAQIATINLQMPDGGSGLTNAEAAAYMGGADVLDKNGNVVIKGLKQADRQRMAALAARVDAINAGTKRLYVQYGLEDPNTLAAWDGVYQHYVPLKRENMDGTTPMGQGFSVKGSASKRALGSSLKVVDILANLALAREAAITRGEKNRVAQAVYGLALQNPNADFWTVDKMPMKKVLDKETGLVVSVPDTAYKHRPDALVLRIGGQDRVVLFSERDERAQRVVAALKNLDVQYLDEFVGKIAQITRYFAAINTQYNPVFGLVNGIRDVGSMALNLTSTSLAGRQAKVLAAVPGAMRAIWQIERNGASGTPWDGLYEDLQLAGGTTGYREIFRIGKDRTDDLRKTIKRMDAGWPVKTWDYVLKLLEDYNTAIENGTRLAVYQAGLDQGMSRAKAASISKNITVNFNRKGRASTDLNAAYAFFNSAVQGTARMGQTLTGPAGKRIILGGVGLGVLQVVIGPMVMGDEEWMKDIPEFVKARNFIIPLTKTEHIMIPMPLGFNALPNMGRIAAEFALTGFKNPGDRTLDLLAAMIDGVNPLGSSTWSQMIAPTIVDPIVALGQNKDFTGRSIYKEDANPLQPTPGFTRARDSSSTASRHLAKGINWASGGTNYTPGIWSPTPDQIDYIFGTLTGGVGRELNKVYQTAELMARGEDVPEYRKPVFGRVFGSTDQDMTVSARFWGNVKDINVAELEVKGRVKDGQDTTAYRKQNPDANLVQMANANERMVAKLKSERHRIEFDPKMPEDVRTARLKEMDTRIIDVMRQFNANVAKARVQAKAAKE